ncbi:MAG: hypothetical protein ACK4I8_02345 [Armatimonadota bacterium]
MKVKKADRKRQAEKLMESLAKKELGDSLMGIRCHGPYEEEDLDVDLLLNEEPPDLDYRSYRIYDQLRKAGFYVVFGYDFWDELEEDEKENWQSLWTPVKQVKSRGNRTKGIEHRTKGK